MKKFEISFTKKKFPIFSLFPDLNSFNRFADKYKATYDNEQHLILSICGLELRNLCSLSTIMFVLML